MSLYHLFENIPHFVVLTTSLQDSAEEKLKIFSGPEEVVYALALKRVHLHTKIELRIKRATKYF